MTDLTLREIQILGLLADGYRIRAISEEFGTTQSTVKTQIYTLELKLRAKTHAHLVALGFREGLLT